MKSLDSFLEDIICIELDSHIDTSLVDSNVHDHVH